MQHFNWKALIKVFFIINLAVSIAVGRILLVHTLQGVYIPARLEQLLLQHVLLLGLHPEVLPVEPENCTEGQQVYNHVRHDVEEVDPKVAQADPLFHIDLRVREDVEEQYTNFLHRYPNGKITRSSFK